MKCFLLIGSITILGIVTVEGYGPKTQRKFHEAPRRFNHGSHRKPSHESRHGFSESPSHAPRHHFRPRPYDYWDHFPLWGHVKGPWNNRDNNPDVDSNISDYDESSYENYGDRYDFFFTKRPCIRPQKRPPLDTTEPSLNDNRLPWSQATIQPQTENPRPKPDPSRAPGEPNALSILTIRPSRVTDSKLESTSSDVDKMTPTEEATTSNPETTTEDEFPTLSPEVQDCIDSCISTPEFNPVCGTNDETYGNEGKLFCAQSCGVDVTLRRRSVCPPPIFDYDDEPPPTRPPTTTTSESLLRTTLFSIFQTCMRLCRITASSVAVCGTDLVTYMNIDRLKCAQACGRDVKVLCEKPCAACGAAEPRTTKTTPLPPTTISSLSRSTPEFKTNDCVDACSKSSEHNPVCGTDNITYRNPGHLLCAQFCGIDVSVARLSQCSPTATTSSTSRLTSTTQELPFPTLSPAMLDCIQRCPVTPEYNPVCGTDNLTYSNLGNLECSKFCGINVELKHHSRCFDEFDLGPETPETTSSRTTQVANGNKDGLITSSTATSGFTFSTFPTTPTTLKTTAAPTTLSASSDTLDFTIPQYVLDNIFGTTTSKVPIKKPLSSDDDENVDLDDRFNIDTSARTNNNNKKRLYSDRIVFPE